MNDALRRLLPAPLAFAWLSDDERAEELWPEERAQLGRAGERRRRDFAAGRHCARAALAALGAPRTALPRREDGTPAWPAGFVGSLTHCGGLALAAVARQESTRSLGVDAERRGRVTPELTRMIATDEERERWSALPPARSQDHLDLLFSAKEAFYKAQFPVSGAWLGFHDVEWTEGDGGGFTLRLRKAVRGLGESGAAFRGRGVVLEEHVVTAFVFDTETVPAR